MIAEAKVYSVEVRELKLDSKVKGLKGLVRNDQAGK